MLQLLDSISDILECIHKLIALNTCLTLLRLMEFSIKFDTVKSRWSIIYIEGLHLIISKKKRYIFLFLKIVFVLAISADPDEMLPYAAFHLGLHSLQSNHLGVSSPKWVESK